MLLQSTSSGVAVVSQYRHSSPLPVSLSFCSRREPKSWILREETESGADRRTAEEKAIDDWLPVTSSRNAKWWYSAFHNLTAMVGVGVLSLPYALSQVGWGFGITVLFMSSVITLYTLWQMVEMHEMVPGKRFDRYHELGQHAFNEKLGLYVVVPQQLIVEVGTCIVYMVTGGKSLQKFQQSVCPDCKPLRTTYFILIFASVHFVLAHLPNFNSISGVSLAAAIISLSALGDVAFAYAGHNVVLEIQATIPSTPEKPSKGPMWLGSVVAYLIVAICYFPVAIIGFYVFGNSVYDNILITLEHPPWLIASANMFVIIHVIGGYQMKSTSTTCSREKCVSIWEVLPGNEFDCVSVVLQGHTQDVKMVQWHPTIDVLFSCSYDNTIKVWADDGDSDDWHCVQTLGESNSRHSPTVWALSFNNSGDKMVTCSDDLTIKVWDVDIIKLQSGDGNALWEGIIATGAADDAIHLFAQSQDHSARKAFA
ncbi:hypothetical protein L2E82_15834 [Cichorium intybus]|uniref:Uncharacterized protein n=1 Tax=Cichorium intybus TaxID=13427 RepID=A0ACB9F4B8_CICIN|nr:hypothetical protein L2E82_15834 [Cichorium intybus]